MTAVAKMPIDLAAEHNQHLLKSAAGNYPNIQQFQNLEGPAENQVTGAKLSISPLALLINFPAGDKISTHASGRALLEAILAEASFYKEALGRRPVGQLLLRHPFNQLSGADVTELMHIVSSSFNLNHRNQGHFEFCAELMFSDVNANNIALLKGLGFNELLLCLPYERPTLAMGDHLKQVWQQAENYGFERLGVRLPYGFIDLDLHSVRAQLDWLLALKPQRIVLSDAETLNQWEDCTVLSQRQGKNNGATAASQFTLIYNALRHAGYRVIGNDCFVQAKDALTVAQNQNRLRRSSIGYNSVNAADVLGLGPGTVSSLGNRFHHNHLQRNTYIQSLEQGPPIQSRLQLNKSGKLARIIADQLLCYHRLDIPYIDSRYDTQLAQFIEDTAWGLNKQAGMELMRIHNGLLQLNDEGVLRILFIIDKFLLELAKISDD